MKILLLEGNEEISKSIVAMLADIRGITHIEIGGLCLLMPYAKRPINALLARVRPDLIIMRWEDFGEDTFAEICRYYQLVHRPPIWVFSECAISLISWKAQEANLFLNIREHFSTDVLRALVRHQAERAAA